MSDVTIEELEKKCAELTEANRIQARALKKTESSFKRMRERLQRYRSFVQMVAAARRLFSATNSKGRLALLSINDQIKTIGDMEKRLKEQWEAEE